MALRFLDSFDHYTTITQKWTISGAGIVAGAARTGAYGLSLTVNIMEAILTLDAQGTWIVGAAYRVADIYNNDPIIRTLDVDVVQGSVRVNADATLSVLRGATVVATSVQSLLANVWYYIEFKHIIDNVAGTLEVRVNGAVWVTFAGNTQQTANPTANQIQLGPCNGAGTRHYDDLYILDGVGGAPNNNYWGDTQIQALVPNGAGNYTELATLVGAASHWEACDEVPPDEDTSYVADNVVDRRDTFAFADLTPTNANINGIQVLIRARETTAGGVAIARLYRRAAVDYQGGDIPVNTSYNYWIREIMEQDPGAGPGAWTVANVNAAEFGFRVR